MVAAATSAFTEIASSVIAAAAIVTAALVNGNRRKLNDVHRIVNGGRRALLDEIATLRAQIRTLDIAAAVPTPVEAERDRLRSAIEFLEGQLAALD
jgi:hypothetical protein